MNTEVPAECRTSFEPLKPRSVSRNELASAAESVLSKWSTVPDKLRYLAAVVFTEVAAANIAKKWRVRKFEQLDRLIAILNARVAELERENERLRANSVGFADAWKGVFERGTLYRKGSLVTWDGSMWIAVRDTDGEPGSNNSGFRLCVKRGRNARGL